MHIALGLLQSSAYSTTAWLGSFAVSTDIDYI